LNVLYFLKYTNSKGWADVGIRYYCWTEYYWKKSTFWNVRTFSNISKTRREQKKKLIGGQKMDKRFQI